MANELSLSVIAAFNKNNDTFSKVFNVLVDVTGNSYVAGVQTIGLSREEIQQLTDLGTPGFVVLKNLDDTNYVDITRADDTNYLIRLEPGEIALFRMAHTTMYLIADTASCDVAFAIFED